MIKIRIKVKAEATTVSKVEFVEDNYIVSRQNPNFLEMVQKVCKESGLKQIEKVSVNAIFDEM